MKLYLQKVRNEKGLSIRALAELSGVSASQIERIENESTNPTIEILCRLARALQVPASDLYSCEN